MGMAMKELNFAQVMLKLQLAGAIHPGDMLRNNIDDHPDWFEGKFIPTPGMPQPHFQTTVGSTVWYLRPFTKFPAYIQFGKNKS